MDSSANKGNGNGANHEVWMCQDGPVTVAVDSEGCPMDSVYCKIQAGATALAIASGAAFVITIAVTNLVFARVRGFIMQASDPAAGAIGSMLDGVGVTGIDVLGNQMISGEVPGTRYSRDVNGPGGTGIRQLYRGDLGTAGGLVTVTGVNRNGVTVNLWAGIDITGKKAA